VTRIGRSFAAPHAALRVRPNVAWAILYCIVVLAGLAALVDLGDLGWARSFMIGAHGRLTLGDHLQVAYYMWLWWHSLATFAHAPWADVFQFALTGHTTIQASGWPLVLVSVPIQAVAGPIAAYNAVFYASFIAAAGFTFLLARALGAPRAAAAVAGFAFAFAPFRLVQSSHANSLLAFLLPLMLYFAERAIRGPGRARPWGWACAATYISIVASGELHLALFASGLLPLFVVVRAIGTSRERLRALVVPAVAAVGASAFVVLLVDVFVLRPGAREVTSASEILIYTPRLGNLYDRLKPSERYAYPGLATFALAVIGFARTLGNRTYRLLGLWLACVTVGVYLFALSPGWRLGFAVYRRIPYVGLMRDPGRILIVAALCLAVLAGFALAGLRRSPVAWFAAAVVMAAMIFDVRGLSPLFNRARAGDNVLAAVPAGAPVLDLPPFPPYHHGSSRYMLDLMRRAGPRVGGYDVLAPESIREKQARTASLTRVPPVACEWRDAQREFGFQYVAVHPDLFSKPPLWPSAGGPGRYPAFGPLRIWPASGEKLIQSLDRTAGFRRVSSIEGVAVYRIDPADLAC
jgi:hypothetical protein